MQIWYRRRNNLFFWYFYLFEVIFLFICWWFPNNLKRKCVADFSINCLWNCQKSEGKEEKEHDFGSTSFTFKFSKLSKFSNNRFWWLLKQMFLNSYQHIRSYNALLLKLRYYKTSSKHAVAMPLHKAYFLTWIYRQLSFIAWKWVDRELYGPKKSPISRDYWQLFLLLCATCLVYY